MTTSKMIGLVNVPIGASSTCLCDGCRHGIFRLDRRWRSLCRHFELGRIDRNRLSAHLLQERDDGSDFISSQPDRVLVDVGPPGRILLGQTFMAVIEVDIGLRLRQTFKDELAAELGADAFEVRTPRRFAGADRMTECALALAEEDLLADRGHVRRRFDGGNVEFFFRGRKGRHLRHRQRHEREETQDDGDKADDPGELSPDKEQNDDPHSDDRQTDQLQLGDFIPGFPSMRK